MDTGIWAELRERLGLTGMAKPAKIGLAALLLLVAVFAGKNLIETATASDFNIGRADASNASEASGLAASASEGEGGQARTVYVHVSGSVKKPGLVELEEGSRVADAIEAAGGFSKDAAAESVNLARVLQDGEQLHVSAAAQASEGASPQQAGGDTSGSGAGGGGSAPAEGGTAAGGGTAEYGVGAGGAAAGNGSGMVNLNTATEEELTSLPGIGEATAAKIVADRAANGPFSAVEDLMRVSGIGEKKLAALDGLICV